MRLFWIFLLLCGVSFGSTDLDGTDDYISVAYHASLDFAGAGQSFTISAWIETDKLTGDQGILGRWFGTVANNQYLLKFESDNNSIKFAVYDTDYQIAESAENSISQDTWTHVLGCANAGTLTVYINGASSGTTDTYGTIVDIGIEENVEIGIDNRGATGEPFEGYLTEIAVWDAALTTDEILLLASSRLKGMPLQIAPANLQGYWPLDDHPTGTNLDGTVYRDLSANGNHGTGDDSDASGGQQTGESVLSYPPPPIGGL